jgi:hypothetical protein
MAIYSRIYRIQFSLILMRIICLALVLNFLPASVSFGLNIIHTCEQSSEDTLPEESKTPCEEKSKECSEESIDAFIHPLLKHKNIINTSLLSTKHGTVLSLSDKHSDIYSPPPQ